MTRRPEQEIQKAVFAHLAARPAPGVVAWHCPNGGQRSPIEAKVFKSLGVVPGIPDVLVLKGGQLYGLELKSETGRLSPAQIATQNALRAAGAICAVAASLNSALAFLEAHGLLRGRRG